jgi:hypothetical protein
MHISLDSALGRQKRLNSVGESVLQIAPDAAAAYSLRSLTGGDPDVVRVRRESDNTEKDFSGSQIESGEMARWVNEQPTLPLDLRELDTNTGERDGALIEAAAAYSLRKLSAEGVDVQPSGDSPRPVADNTDLFLPDDFPVTLQRNGEGYFIKETGADWFANYVGATLYVSPSGNDATGDGSSSNPYQSLNTVISNASDNDIISMSAGIYAMPTLAVSKDLAFVCPSGKAYIGTFNDLSSAQIDAIDYSGTALHNVDDVVTGETFKGWIRTDGTLVGGVRGSAVSGTNGQAIDYQNFGVMSVYAGSTSANFSTGTSETLQELVNAGSVLAWSDADTDRFRVATGTSVYIGENITLASYGTDVVAGIGSANLILDGCEIYGGSNNCVSHPSSGSVLMFNTLVAGSNQDNIDYRGTAIAVESNITSNWCNTGVSDNASTGHDSCKVLRVGGTYRGGSRTVHDVNNTKAYVYSCTIGDAVSNDKTLLLSGFSTIGSETCTLGYGDITFIDTFNDGGLTNLYIDSEATATNSELNQGWSYFPAGKYVVQTRRNVDGATKSFTAAEVTDGTLESFVNASFDDELPLDQATGAAAAYSLRNLSSSYTGNVVEVRRSSDDAVQAFTASEVADGTLKDWVTASLSNGVFQNNGYETYSGASESGFSATNTTTAGFATSTIPSGVTGNKLKVSFDIVVVSGSPKIALRATTGAGTASNSSEMTTSGSYTVTLTATGSYSYVGFSEGDAPSDFTVSNFQIIGQDGHVRTWYDQSGSTPANDATQTDPTKQPKIVEDGNLLKDSNNKPEIDFDGTDDFLSSDHILSQDDLLAVHAVAKFNNNTDRQRLVGNTFYVSTSNNGGFNLENKVFNLTELAATLDDASVSTYAIGSSSDIDTSNEQLFTLELASGTLKLYTDGTELDSVSAQMNSEDGGGTLAIGASSDGASPLDGTIQEIIIYNSDQSDKRRAIEENIANHYDISLAAFSRDGTVSTWYDQSGSDNDAVQTDTAKQPTIVVNGTYLGEVNFDGTGDVLGFTDIDFSGGDFFVNATYAWDGTADSYIVADSANHWIIRPYASNGFQSRSEDLTQYTISPTDHTFISGELVTTSVFRTSNTLNLAVNGSADDTTNDVTSKTFSCNQLGARAASHYFGDAIKEVIIYNTDQSDNRTALEANIGETYGITGIPAANDTVNGFVQTWYDQSGSGNDVVQDAAANQPKIVDAGTYLEEVDFDGTQHFETISSGILTNIQDTYSVWLGKRRNNSSGYLAQASSASGGSNRLYLRYGLCTIGAEAAGISIAATNDVNTIVSLTGSGGTYDGFKNGADVNDTETTASTGAGAFTLGASSTGLSPVDGTLKEFIIYDSDQSANRTAIEANVANQYGITLS